MKTTTLTKPQRAVLAWLIEDDKRTLLARKTEKGGERFHQVDQVATAACVSLCAKMLKAKRLIEQSGKVGDCTAYRVSSKGRKVLKYNQDKRAI